MSLSPFALPVPLSDGEGARAVLTTVGTTTPDQPATGTLIVAASSGEIDRWHTGLSTEFGPGWLGWNTLQSIPFSQAIVTKIYAAAVVRKPAPGSTGLMGYITIRCLSSAFTFGTRTIVDQTAPSGQYSVLLPGDPTSLDLTGITFDAVNRSTLLGDLAHPGDISKITAIGLVVYYTVNAIPIGHAANCNDYGPIGLNDGATSAPGNGALINI